MTTRRILLTGASGLVGTELCRALISRNWELVILGRQPEASFRKRFLFPCEYYSWTDPVRSAPPKEALNVNSVINLMGEPIAGKRWSQAQKIKIRDSRVESTRQLVSALASLNPRLETFISCSAIGYYGDTADTSVNEEAAASNDFLGQVCKDWENAASLAPGRKVLFRLGIVLSEKGGALRKMLPAFELGLGGALGTGKQWMSWIHINDLIQTFIDSLENPRYQGPINAVSPTPVTNKEFTETLAAQLGKVSFLAVPSFALKLALGEMAELLLGSQKIEPARLKSLGYEFQFPTLEKALKELLPPK